MATTPPIVELNSGELYVYGNPIQRHQTKPWLFCASEVHEALKDVIQEKAFLNNRDEEKYFQNTHPKIWVRDTFSKEGYVAKLSLRTRSRITRFGAAVGFGLPCPPDDASSSLLEGLSDFEVIYEGIRGRGKNAGSYLCLDALVDYILNLDPTLADDLHRHNLIEISSVKEAHKTATTERLEHQFAFYLSIIAESFNYKLSTQVSVLQYYLDFLLKSPKGKYIVIEYDEHRHRYQTKEDNERILNVVNHLKKHKKIPHGLTVLRCKQGEEKKFLVELSKKLQGKVSSLPSQEFIS